MAINYNRLWKLLIDKKMKRTELMHAANISSNVLARLSRDKAVSMESMAKICEVLDCNIGDVMDFVPEAENVGKRRNVDA